MSAQIDRLIEVGAPYDNGVGISSQVAFQLDKTGLTSADWQTESILVNLPNYAPATAVIIAELHGRCGHFPPIIRMQPRPDAQPRSFEVAEIVDLQMIRDQARRIRTG